MLLPQFRAPSTVLSAAVALGSRFAAMQNPPVAKQQSSIFYAITTNDNASIKAMADGGWSLTKLQVIRMCWTH